MHRSGLLLAAAFLLMTGTADASPQPGVGGTASAKPDTQPDKPAPAKRATSIPEPGNPTILFLLAAGGLALGRRLSRSKRRRSPDA